MSEDVSKSANNENSHEKENIIFTDDAKEASTDISGLTSSIEKLNQEIVDLKDKYVRAVAEMENMRRRIDRERGELVKFALENVLKDLLPTLDSFEKALPDTMISKEASVAEEGFLSGMAMVKKQLLDVLKKHGLEAIEAKGQLFDPNVHQAIQRLESNEVEKDTIAEEFARGYTLHGRLLRPAIVSVLSPAGS